MGMNSGYSGWSRSKRAAYAEDEEARGKGAERWRGWWNSRGGG